MATLPLAQQVTNLELNEPSQDTLDIQHSEVNESEALSSSPSSSDEILSIVTPPSQQQQSNPNSPESPSSADSSSTSLVSISSSSDSDAIVDDDGEDSMSSDQAETQLPLEGSCPPTDNRLVQASQPQVLSQPVQFAEPINIQRVARIGPVFNVVPNDDDASHAPDFDPPRRCGFYSCLTGPSGNRLYREDKSSLRYFLQPSKQSGCNLMDGYSERLALQYQSQDALYILKYISNNFYELKQNDADDHDHDHDHDDDDDDDDDDDSENRPIADFICSSDVLARIMSSPYNSKQTWTLIGVKVHGAIIILDKEVPIPSHSKLFEDRKFIEYVTRRHDRSRTNPDGIQECFYSITRSVVGNKRLLYSFPVHGALMQHNDRAIDSMNFIQTKLRPASWNNNSNQRRMYWRTYGLDLWCSCFLGRVERLIFGDKEPGGWVKNIDTSFMPSDIPKPNLHWTPKGCFKALDNALTFFMNEIKAEKVPYLINFSCEARNISCDRLDESAEKYIPSWYLSSQTRADQDTPVPN